VNGRVFRHTTTVGETTTFTYNEFRRETVARTERGHVRRFVFDADGNPLRLVEENGAERGYTYDTGNADVRHRMNRLSKRGPLGQVTGYACDADGNVTRVTLPSGSTVAGPWPAPCWHVVRSPT
jgi:YD repeat-containing protein